jgi:4-hydroxybenzoate polyprenyltransferase
MATATQTIRPLERLRTYASFVRFEHTLFSLPLLFAGVFSAPGPTLGAARWALIAVAAVGARTAALAMNRLIDRRIDARNPRTQARELPSGRMSAREAVTLLGVSLVAYLAACAALGPWFLRVSWVPLAVFVVYPYLKRVTPLCHFGVGLALGLAPMAGYAVAHPGLEAPYAAVWLGAFGLFWVAGFDIIYATLDEEFDRAHGVQSMVAWLGRAAALKVSAALHLAAMLTLVPVIFLLLGHVSNEPARAAPTLVVIATGIGVLLGLEQRWGENVNLAFFKVNVVVGFAVLALVLAARAAGGFH